MDTDQLADELATAQRQHPPDLDEAELPAGPAVYAWWFNDESVYVGPAGSLREQLFDRDLRGGQSPIAPARRVARDRLRRDGLLSRGQTRTERIATIDRFLSECAVSWVTVDRSENVGELASSVAAQLVEVSGWEPRPGEDQMLRRYLDRLDHPGRVYVEVPIGASTGRPGRRVDAVRFPTLAAEVRYYDPASFTDALTTGRVELIEVKRALNRPVFGQLLIARDLAVTEWELPSSTELSCVALVGSSDPALEPIFNRYGLRVVLDTNEQ